MAKKPQPGRDTTCVPLKSLRPGRVLSCPIFETDHPVLLIAAGLPFTKGQIDRLLARGITEVRVGLADLEDLVGDRPCAAQRRTGRAGPALTEALLPTPRFASAIPFLMQPQRDHTPQSRERLTSVFSSRFEKSVIEVRDIFNCIASGKSDDARQIVCAVEGAMADMSGDFDVYLAVGMEPDPDRYPYSHSLQVSRLALSIGAMLGIDKAKLVELGVGCMLHDAGMLKLDPELANREHPLDYLDRLDITKHSTFTFDLIQGMFGLPAGARMVAYQMHERLDGSGYPRRRVGSQIHPLSKIAMVADSFIAMTSPRPYRPAIPPYYVMVELLDATQQGKFDPEAMRGLLEAISLFPVGSFVELNDGRAAKVIGANRENVSRPIVELVLKDWDDEPEIINLLTDPHVSIVRPLLDPRLWCQLRKSQMLLGR